MNPAIRLFPPAAFAMAAVLFSTPVRVEAFGGPPGGPFSNGSYFPNDGTFAAVVRGTNLSGTLQFSTTGGAGPAAAGGGAAVGNAGTTGTGAATEGGSTGAAAGSAGGGGTGSTGVANIYYSGSTFRGNSQGSYNPADSGMEVTFQAEAAGTGSGQILVQQKVQSSTTSNGSTTNSYTLIPVTTLNYYDSKSLNGFANCQTSNSFPNQKLKGLGEVVVQELFFANSNSSPEVVTSQPIRVSVTGVRLSDTAANFNTTSVTSPSVVRTTILTNPDNP
jgi:hypothetical protein